MEWTKCISNAISYIEDNISHELTMEDIAKSGMISPYYFQKGFALLCGFTVGDYIKKRRLTLAGAEVLSTDNRIIDIAMKYGYDSPDSFTKAFTRFHGSTPTSVRKGDAMIKTFAPLTVKFSLEGGYTMDYKIVKKDEFTVIGGSTKLNYDEAPVAIPNFWAEFSKSGKNEQICTMYGINIDESMKGDTFEYLIADNYDPTKDIPEGFVTKVIPELTWAVFACNGPMPVAIQDTNKRIFSEWLPNGEYEIAAGYNIEMYDVPDKYPNGVNDENYYCEVWIPVKKK